MEIFLGKRKPVGWGSQSKRTGDSGTNSVISLALEKGVWDAARSSLGLETPGLWETSQMSEGFSSCLPSGWMLGKVFLWAINSFIHLFID